LADEQLGAIAGVPSEADIQTELGELSKEDSKYVAKTLRLVAEHLGSFAAARLWFLTPEDGTEMTPARAIREGRAKQVLAVLESQWGRNPAYA